MGSPILSYLQQNAVNPQQPGAGRNRYGQQQPRNPLLLNMGLQALGRYQAGKQAQSGVAAMPANGPGMGTAPGNAAWQAPGDMSAPPAGMPPVMGSEADEGTGFDAEPGGNMAMGRIVTSPTIARLGEQGPEAVVPLGPKVGAHVRPDMLEGHGALPKLPGVRYQQYKGFVKPSF